MDILENLKGRISFSSNRILYLKDESEMVLVPEGDFVRGADKLDLLANPDEKPSAKVYLSSYLIDVFPVTNSSYKRFVEDGGYNRKEYWTESGWDFIRVNKISKPLGWELKEFAYDDHPVCGVNWYEAEAYCRWSGKMLSTEAQWEKAAIGTKGLKFPWGNDLPGKETANFNNALGTTSPVNAYPAGKSVYGCYDMSGNVNNWCRDWYSEDFYRLSLVNNNLKNPLLDDKTAELYNVKVTDKVDKGGGFATDVSCWRLLSGSAKIHWQPLTRNIWNGFRTVVEIT